MEQEFLNNLRTRLNWMGNFDIDTSLTDIEEWDSLSVVSFSAMSLMLYNVQLTANDVKKCQTIRDLFNLVKVC